jgi:hypothetical protein
MFESGRNLQISGAARVLRRWPKLGGLAAALLADGGPLPFLGAQALYFAAPLLGAFSTPGRVENLAALLEDPQSLQALARELAPPEAA